MSARDVQEQTRRAGTFRDDVASRGLEALKPATAAEARGALLDLVDRQMEHLTARAETHREHQRAKTARLAGLLEFDDTIEGERLRRFEITSGRGYFRVIDAFLKLRTDDRGRRNEDLGDLTRVVSCPWSVVRCLAVHCWGR